jgi:hypothetical protein
MKRGLDVTEEAFVSFTGKAYSSCFHPSGGFFYEAIKVNYLSIWRIKTELCWKNGWISSKDITPVS